MSQPSSPRATVRIGTRASALALWQSNHVAQMLRDHHPDLVVELVEITTEGDRIQDRPLHEVGGKGLFVKGIQSRLLSGDVDLAVHSMKDLPGQTPDGLVIACTPPAEDPRDVVVGNASAALCRLPPGTRVGTGSLRRSALVRRINPGVTIVPIRGNVPTRVGKIDAGELDVVILAAAGLRRLGLHDRIVETLDPQRFCPSPSQGILALECRADDESMHALLQPLTHGPTAVRAAAERAFVQRLGASCTVPVGCHATLHDDEQMSVAGLVVDPTGRPCFSATKTSRHSDAAQLGHWLAEALLSLGADRIVDPHRAA